MNKLKCIPFFIKSSSLKLHWIAQNCSVYAYENMQKKGWWKSGFAIIVYIKVYIRKNNKTNNGHKADLTTKETSTNMNACTGNVRAIPGISRTRPVVVCVWLVYNWH